MKANMMQATSYDDLVQRWTARCEELLKSSDPEDVELAKKELARLREEPSEDEAKEAAKARARASRPVLASSHVSAAESADSILARRRIEEEQNFISAKMMGPREAGIRSEDGGRALTFGPMSKSEAARRLQELARQGKVR